ncbi:MAG: alpha/beta fold hydrolase [Gammaproteobacteria bacterium]|nr:alpha/beta fold hydrolase [Gammaproteobacteria bacterium]
MKEPSIGPEVRSIERDDGVHLAAQISRGDGLTAVFLNGFRSDMSGTKARAMHRWAKRRGTGVLTFDYSGHGRSEGVFEECTVSTWIDDALRVISCVTEQPLVLIGSSMGGWIALHVALRLRSRVRGVVGIASAPDFLLELTSKRLDERARLDLAEHGVTYLPSRYGDGSYPITSRLLEDGRGLGLLHAPIPLTCPVRLLHGMADPEVPWELSTRLAGAIQGNDVHVELIKGGDHRLSKPHELERLFYWLDDVSAS